MTLRRSSRRTRGFVVDDGVRLVSTDPDGTEVTQPLRAKFPTDYVKVLPAFELHARREGDDYVCYVYLGDEIVFEVVKPERAWHFDGLEAFAAYTERKFAQCLAWAIETRT